MRSSWCALEEIELGNLDSKIDKYFFFFLGKNNQTEKKVSKTQHSCQGNKVYIV